MPAVETAGSTSPLCVVGRYALYEAIASGGMASVHFGRMRGPAFTRTVAIKRLHPHLATDPEFVRMLLDEARLVSRISHPNVVSTLDVATTSTEVFVVMEYVHGEVLSRLVQRAQQGNRIPLPIVSSIIGDVLRGLHAAHEATNERGEPLGIVHRDVSPQNIIVDVDGASHVLDFGVAKAVGRLQTTQDSKIKGKLAYMAPEQLLGNVTRQTDVYATAVVLWELLTLRRLWAAEAEPQLLYQVMNGQITAPGKVVQGLPEGLDEIVMNGLAAKPEHRFTTARAMAVALTHCIPPASPLVVGEWLRSLGGDALRARAEVLANIESSSDISDAAASARAEGRVIPQSLEGPPVSDADFASGPADAPTSLGLASTSTGSSHRIDPPRRRLPLLLGVGAFGLAVVVTGIVVLASGPAADPVRLSAAGPPEAVPAFVASASAAPPTAGPNAEAHSEARSAPPEPTASHPALVSRLPAERSPPRSTRPAATSTRPASDGLTVPKEGSAPPTDDSPPKTRF